MIQVSNTLGVAHALSGHDDQARRDLEGIRAVDLAGSNAPQADVSPTLTAFHDPTFQNLPRYFIRADAPLASCSSSPGMPTTTAC